MKELSNGQLQDDFLQSLWLQRMPPHIQTVLSASSESLDKLAIIADKVSRLLVRPRLSVPATTVPPPSQSFFMQCSGQLWTLSSGSHPRASVNRGSGICYYHRRYKERNRKVFPCAFCAKTRVSSVIAEWRSPSQHTSRLFLLDRKSGQKFLIDSGSEICVIPPSPTMNKSPQSNFPYLLLIIPKFQLYGMVRKELNLGLRRPFI
ncbi:uncharacterized protein TNCV_3543521 [Trichonephila clavipes]|nr:uncharacterized protein TNCV_3543521 [Trichonephila clavipes]